jgi:integrase
MRQGEIMAAKWEHLNVEKGTYYVCESVNRRQEIGPTKTGDTGDVWVPPSLLNALEDQRRQIATWELAADSWKDHGLIFPARATGRWPNHKTILTPGIVCVTPLDCVDDPSITCATRAPRC